MTLAPRFYQTVKPGSGLFLVACLAAGCASPFQTETAETLRESVLESTRRELAEAEAYPERGEPAATAPSLDFSEERMEELNQMAGPDAYEEVGINLEDNLTGQPTTTFRVDLKQAITRAVENNLAVQAGRLSPAISESAVVSAQAAFDWIFFADFNWGRTDSPQTVPVVNGIPVGASARQDQSVGYSTGIRRDLTSGGSLSISQGLTYTDNTGSGVDLAPDPANRTFLEIDFSQPLLRGFGSDVALADVRLARNDERRSVYGYKLTLIEVATQTERAYWELVLAQRNLEIQQRLLDRGIETRDVLESRRTFDVKPAEFSDAVATVERRRADIIRAENLLRLQSDSLKALINDPELTVGSETQLLAIDDPIEEPVFGSMRDALVAAVRNRPEIQQAILDIDDASIRLTVARNARLPALDARFNALFQGLDEDVDGAYEDIGDANFVDMVFSLLFEQPIGNRAAQANLRASQLARMQATINYRRTVQDVVLDVKTALRFLVTNYRLIEQTRTSRLAATENLRTLIVQEQTIQSLTPDFLDLKFRRQESLAQAELDEVQAVIDYNSAIAELYRATGTALERNRIRLEVPDAAQFLDVETDFAP